MDGLSKKARPPSPSPPASRLLPPPTSSTGESQPDQHRLKPTSKLNNDGGDEEEKERKVGLGGDEAGLSKLGHGKRKGEEDDASSNGLDLSKAPQALSPVNNSDGPAFKRPRLSQEHPLQDYAPCAQTVHPRAIDAIDSAVATKPSADSTNSISPIDQATSSDRSGLAANPLMSARRAELLSRTGDSNEADEATGEEIEYKGEVDNEDEEEELDKYDDGEVARIISTVGDWPDSPLISTRRAELLSQYVTFLRADLKMDPETGPFPSPERFVRSSKIRLLMEITPEALWSTEKVVKQGVYMDEARDIAIPLWKLAAPTAPSTLPVQTEGSPLPLQVAILAELESPSRIWWCRTCAILCYFPEAVRHSILGHARSTSTFIGIPTKFTEELVWAACPSGSAATLEDLNEINNLGCGGCHERICGKHSFTEILEHIAADYVWHIEADAAANVAGTSAPHSHHMAKVVEGSLIRVFPQEKDDCIFTKKQVKRFKFWLADKVRYRCKCCPTGYSPKPACYELMKYHFEAKHPEKTFGKQHLQAVGMQDNGEDLVLPCPIFIVSWKPDDQKAPKAP